MEKDKVFNKCLLIIKLTLFIFYIENLKKNIEKFKIEKQKTKSKKANTWKIQESMKFKIKFMY